MRSSMLKFIILSILIGLTKAAHFRMMVFAVLGLAGLWMVQNIAKSSGGGGDERSNLFPNFSVANLANRFLTKRSIDDVQANKIPVQIIDWDFVLTNDHSTCTRSYVCQLSASDLVDLHPQEFVILDIIRQSTNTEDVSWAHKQIQVAIKHGEKWKNKAHCMKIYKRCPYSSRTMLSLLNAFDERT